MNTNTNRIVCIGTLPPPVTGMALTTQTILETIEKNKISVRKLNTSPLTLNRNFFHRISRFPRYIRAWVHLLFFENKENTKLYIPISGEFGQLYDIITVGIAKLKGIPCIISHHSFTYIDNPRFVTKILFKLAGESTYHIARCEYMKGKIIEHYQVNKVLILTNMDLRFQPSRTISKLTKIGYISNITRDKGGYIILELAYAIRENNLPIKLIVAGPCHETELIDSFKKAEKEGVLEWIGAVYDDDKKHFWNSIDTFVFPTQYANEAEPRVIWESISHGIPVISYERGCIPEQIKNSGIAVCQQDDFVDTTIAILKKWCGDNTSFEIYTNATQECYKRMQNIVSKQWEEFIQCIEKE